MAFDHKLEEGQLKALASVFSALAVHGRSAAIDFGNQFIETRERWVRAQAIQAASRVAANDPACTTDMIVRYAILFEQYIDEGFTAIEDQYSKDGINV